MRCELREGCSGPEETETAHITAAACRFGSDRATLQQQPYLDAHATAFNKTLEKLNAGHAEPQAMIGQDLGRRSTNWPITPPVDR
jgi:hypothetical protein